MPAFGIYRPRDRVGEPARRPRRSGSRKHFSKNPDGEKLNNDRFWDALLGLVRRGGVLHLSNAPFRLLLWPQICVCVNVPQFYGRLC